MAETSNGQGERGITALFVRRPVLAFVINTLIAVAGMAAFYGVEIRELPDVDRPVITVTTDYTGASAETIDRELTAVLEGAVSRVSGVKAISSSSSFERSRVTVEFSDGVNLDVAASDMRDAVSRVTNQLPDDIDPPRIVKADANADAVMRLAVTSDNIPVEDMTIIVEDQILDTLSAVPGVADVQVYGDRDKIFRVDVNQAKVASHGLTIASIANALETVAFDTPAGSLTTGNMDIVVRATATVNTPDAFESIIINGRTRLGDVASVTLGGDPSATSLRSDGKTGIGLGIIRAAQSNTLDISTGVRAAAAKIQETLPKGMNIRVTSDDATFINGAIHEVELALGLSVTIVLAVIFLFLRDWRATLIPGLAMPVALIGTIAAIYMAGFSVNILTLLALVLATGLVVDDAIVVLENIVRRRNQGMGPRAAAVLGTREVFFAVIATTATLAAVFIPLSFLPGQTGGLFREFGFVLAMSVLLSSVVALSLCPMLASRMLTEAVIHHHDGGIGGRIGGALAGLYQRMLHACLGAPLIVLLVCVIFAAHRLRHVRVDPPGTDADRGSLDRHAAHRRTAGRQPRLYDAADPRHRAADPAAARFRRDQRYLRQRRPGRPEQQRLHGAVAGAMGQARAFAAGHRRPAHRPVEAGTGRPHHARCSRTASAFAAPATACSSPLSATATRSSATPPTRSSPRWRRTRASSSRG